MIDPLRERMLQEVPVGTQVRLLPSDVNAQFAQATGFNPTGQTGTVEDWAVYYKVKLGVEIPHPMFADQTLCVLRDEFEVLS
jgi:hypothetical protein